VHIPSTIPAIKINHPGDQSGQDPLDSDDSDDSDGVCDKFMGTG
jgi:hypothetical protein